MIDSLALLTVSPGRGFLVYSPIAALGLAVLVKQRYRTRYAAIVVAAFVGAMVVALLNPGGGVNWGTRYLLPVIPLGVTGLALLPRGLGALAAGFGAWGLLIHLPTILVPFESAYRGPVAAGRSPSSLYWSIESGPIVQLWNQFPSVLSERSSWVIWWRELPGLWLWMGAAISLALVGVSVWLVARALRAGERGTVVGLPRERPRDVGVRRDYAET